MIILNGVKPSKETVGKRTTTESSPPGDRKIERRKRCVTHPGFNIRASSTSAFKGQVANSRPQQEPESIYPGTTGAIPGACNVRPHEPHTPMPRAPRPQEPGRSRPPMATTWAPRPDPWPPHGAKRHPHRDPVVTPVMRNVHSHPAEATGETSQTSHPLAPSAEGWMTCSPRPLYHPLRAPRGFLVPKFSTYDGTNDPFDHIMHYRQLMTLDIGNDALLCKVFPASLQGQALSWFHRLPPNSVGNFRDLSEAFVGQYLCSLDTSKISAPCRT
ncbi:hypothetical protein CK203_033232 [Vitis vinifera]|uniref:Retrotransposon gag domain-containing protein n=1 Tax=Vitis vinifera TaxID=29760 RepID=A0A438HBR2_VITVI|nr:hypothetical protein CK203_033232 [Vitis vinifera]